MKLKVFFLLVFFILILLSCSDISSAPSGKLIVDVEPMASFGVSDAIRTQNNGSCTVSGIGIRNKTATPYDIKAKFILSVVEWAGNNEVATISLSKSESEFSIIKNAVWTATGCICLVVLEPTDDISGMYIVKDNLEKGKTYRIKAYAECIDVSDDDLSNNILYSDSFVYQTCRNIK